MTIRGSRGDGAELGAVRGAVAPVDFEAMDTGVRRAVTLTKFCGWVVAIEKVARTGTGAE